MVAKTRIDILMVERGLTPSRSFAQRLIMAGQVRVEGQLVHKASEKADNDATVEITALPKYVSRGGEKLEAALRTFEISPVDWVCADVGASTGGFTDCLLQTGAHHVYAIDVGKGQLHWRLRSDDRVKSIEETNARYLELLPEPIDLVVIDVSFISLSLIFPIVRAWLKPSGIIVALIKPQFEAGKDQVGKRGVVRDPHVHDQVIRSVYEGASASDLYLHGLILSPLKGPKGNIEFLALFKQEPTTMDVDDLISTVIPSNHPQNGN